jgi:hypothetical protein
MRIRSVVVVIAIAVVSSFATWHWASAQDATPRPQTQYEEAFQSMIKTGADIGFRVEAMRGNTATGRLVVRVNGRWMDAEPSMRVTPLQH